MKKRRRFRRYRHLLPIFLPFLAELDISESFETNLFFLKKISLVFAFAPCKGGGGNSADF